MKDPQIHLNIGCGIVYKPGYVNIDLQDDAVADTIADADTLPYPPSSVTTIEAYHLIEHFDLAHCKYVLAHWFRLLKPGETLVIETPDMERALTEFIKGKNERKRTLLQWIYGIESPGMAHRTGFTFKHLTDVLEQCGFTDVTRGERGKWKVRGEERKKRGLQESD